MKKDLIVGIGEALWDCFPEGRKFGGAPTNFAYHSGQFGWHSIVISAVGQDALGDEILEIIKGIKLDSRIARVAYPTGTVQVTLSGDGIPAYEICENVAWDNIPWTDELESIAKRTRAVCFGSLAQRSPVSRATILKFLDTMDPDTERIYDINLRQHFYSLEVIEASLKRATILKLNEEEIEIVSALFHLTGSAAERCRQLISKFDTLQTVILTCGAVGSNVFTENETSYVDTPKVKVADTVGAGDSFTATFVAQYLKGKSIQDAHRIAVKASAFVCTQEGATPVFPKEILEA